MSIAMTVEAIKIPKEFIRRRIHSLMGFWFLLFLTEHLFTNSQAALFFSVHAPWFASSVNFLRNLPYLNLIEIILLGVPILYHIIWGIYYMFSMKSNAFISDGSKPRLSYARNVAYTMQRLSSWVILVGIILHVIQMRFLDYPYKYFSQKEGMYYLPLKVDPGLYRIADDLKVTLYNRDMIEEATQKFQKRRDEGDLVSERIGELKSEMKKEHSLNAYNDEYDEAIRTYGKYALTEEHIQGLHSRSIAEHQVMAASSNFGNLELLSVRETFKSIWMCIFYTIFVLAAVYHGFNGLWTFLITWGIILSRKSHVSFVHFCYGLMLIVGLLGMLSIWGTFILNLRA